MDTELRVLLNVATARDASMATAVLERATLGACVCEGMTQLIAEFVRGAGALFIAPLSDRFGRRRLLVGCVAWFSLFTIAVVFAPNVAMFGIFRLLAGVGLGSQRGNQNMLSSIATLAYDCRRPEYFTDQLYAALQLVDRGVISVWGASNVSFIGGDSGPSYDPGSSFRSSWISFDVSASWT